MVRPVWNWNAILTTFELEYSQSFSKSMCGRTACEDFTACFFAKQTAKRLSAHRDTETKTLSLEESFLC